MMGRVLGWIAIVPFLLVGCVVALADALYRLVTGRPLLGLPPS